MRATPASLRRVDMHRQRVRRRRPAGEVDERGRRRRRSTRPAPSRLPRSTTSTAAGIACATRFGAEIPQVDRHDRAASARPAPARSATVTIAGRASSSRSAGSSDADGDRVVTARVAPATETGSVSASVDALHGARGPDDLDRRRIDGRSCRRRSPAPGSPSTAGTTGTCASPTARTSARRVDGVTCTTSTPNGTRTCSGVR